MALRIESFLMLEERGAEMQSMYQRRTLPSIGPSKKDSKDRRLPIIKAKKLVPVFFPMRTKVQTSHISRFPELVMGLVQRVKKLIR